MAPFPPPAASAAAPYSSSPLKSHLRPPFLSVKLLLFLLLLSVSLVLLPLSISLAMPSLLFPASSSFPHRYLPPSRSLLLSRADAVAFPVLSFLRRTCFNQTLLDMAAVDLAEPEERREIGKILGGSWRRRYPDSLDQHHDLGDYRLNRQDPSWRITSSSSSSSSSSSAYRERYRQNREREHRLPLQLSRPRYEPHWGAFKQLLQSWVSKKRHEPKVMAELLRLVKEPIDRHYMKQQQDSNVSATTTEEWQQKQIQYETGKPYGSCAVVGNSGILLNQSYGAQIDSHDMVMRLNNAKIKGFEQHVGSKTTISFVNSNILHMCERRGNCFCHPYGSDVPIVMYICQVVHFMDVAFCNSKLQAPIVVTDPRFDTLCSRIVKYYSLKLFSESGNGAPPRRLSDWSDAHEGTFFHYSSGMQAVLLAVGICDRVSMFGFGKSPSARHHYHSLQKEELRLHDYMAEYQFYKDLATRNPRLVPFLDDAGISIPPVDIYW